MLLLSKEAESGDKEQVFFETLYQRYSRLLYSKAKQYSNSEDDAEDIFQDTIERLLKRIPKLMELPDFALPAYLISTVRSVAINYQKHLSVIEKHAKEMGLAEWEYYLAVYKSPNEVLERKEQQRELVQILEKIPREDFELLYRKYVLMQSDEELGTIYHCKKDSIRMKLTRIRRKVLQVAKEHEIK